MKEKETIIYLVTTIVTFIFLVTSIVFGFFEFLGDKYIQAFVSLCFSVFGFIVGERIANFSREKKTLNHFLGHLPNELKMTFKFNTIDDAYSYLEQQLPHARKIYNTRIQKEREKERIPRESEISYNSCIEKVIQRKDIEFHEVVSQKYYEKSLDRIKIANKNNLYVAKYIDIIPPAFLNFTIIHHKDLMPPELIFGWATNGYDNDVYQPVFKITDRRIIDYFQVIFNELSNNGKDVVEESK